MGVSSRQEIAPAAANHTIERTAATQDCQGRTTEDDNGNTTDYTDCCRYCPVAFWSTPADHWPGRFLAASPGSTLADGAVRVR